MEGIFEVKLVGDGYYMFVEILYPPQQLIGNPRHSTPRKNVCACVGHKKNSEEFKCQIVNKNMAI
jgi:hypothetical protein